MDRRLTDVLRGAAALAALVVLVVAVPAGLVTFVGWPLPTELPTWQQVNDAIGGGHIDNWALVKALAVLVWLSWAHLTSSVIAETIALARGRRARCVPGPGSLQMAAANLVASATLLFTGVIRPTAAAAQELPDLPCAVADTVHRPNDGMGGGRGVTQPQLLAEIPTRRALAPQKPTETDRPLWLVRPRDTLWHIAEQALGDGLRWREIQQLNLGRRQPDGDALQPGDDHIRPGWVLVLPIGASIPEAASGRPSAESENQAADVITVAPGDSIWELAGKHLDSPFRWPKLYEENRGRPQPDGRRLTDPDHIHPGWRLKLPDQPVGPGNGQRPVNGNPPSEVENTSPQGANRPNPPPDRQEHPQPSVLALTPAENVSTPPSPAERVEAAPDAHEELRDPEVIRDDVRDETLAVAGIGVVAAGVAATLDRIRRARRRRRAPGQRIPLPQPPLADTELRVRGLADQATTRLVDAALRALLTERKASGQPAPAPALVSTSPSDIAIHLIDPDPHPPAGWRSEDDGLTWVLPRGHDPAPFDATVTDGAASMPLLVTIGTTAHAQRRVLLNLAHARMVGVNADPQTRLTLLLGHALELATTIASSALRVVVVGFGEVLAPLERIQLSESPAEAVALLERAANEAATLAELEEVDAADAEATVGLFLEPLEAELLDRLQRVTAIEGVAVTAVVAAAEAATCQLTDRDGIWHLAPYEADVEQLELTGSELEQMGESMLTAKGHSYASAPLADEALFDAATETSEAPIPDLVTGQTTGESPLEVCILGPVAVNGAERFPTAKAEELVVYLATHRHGADADSMMEALWPGQPPNPSRLHTEVWRARQALGNAPDGNPYLPRVDRGRYRLSPDVRLDYERFRTLVARGRKEPDQALHALRSALELVRGRPFSGTSSEYVWTSHDLHVIEQEIGDVAHELAEMYLEQGDLNNAAWAAEHGLRADPYFEVLYRDLMRIAAGAGNTAEIHATVARLRRVVSGDGDGNDADDWLDPETVRVYQQLTRNRIQVPDG